MLITLKPFFKSHLIRGLNSYQITLETVCFVSFQPIWLCVLPFFA